MWLLYHPCCMQPQSQGHPLPSTYDDIMAMIGGPSTTATPPGLPPPRAITGSNTLSSKAPDVTLLCRSPPGSFTWLSGCSVAAQLPVKLSNVRPAGTGAGLSGHVIHPRMTRPDHVCLLLLCATRQWGQLLLTHCCPVVLPVAMQVPLLLLVPALPPCLPCPAWETRSVPAAASFVAAAAAWSSCLNLVHHAWCFCIPGGPWWGMITWASCCLLRWYDSAQFGG